MKKFKQTLLRTGMAAVIALGAVVSQSAMAMEPAKIEAALKAAYDKYKGLQEGKNADYIPVLAKVDPNIFGITLVTTDGKVYSVGDVKSEVSIQSISKVFTMAKVIEESGSEAISNNMGVDATGQVFNSIVAIEQYQGKEMNAMVNPGAITATSMVKGANGDEVWNKIITTYNDFAGRELKVDEEVYKSEADTNQRNQSLAMLMAAYGRLDGITLDGVGETIDVPGGDVLNLPVRARAHRDDAYGIMAIEFSVTAVDDENVSVVEDSRFLGPTP